MGQAAKRTRANRTITVDFRDDATYVQLLGNSRLQLQTPAVACGRGVLWHDDLPSLSARIAWKGAFLYNALECAHLFTIQGRAL